MQENKKSRLKPFQTAFFYIPCCWKVPPIPPPPRAASALVHNRRTVQTAGKTPCPPKTSAKPPTLSNRAISPRATPPDACACASAICSPTGCPISSPLRAACPSTVRPASAKTASSSRPAAKPPTASSSAA
nr:MAG TPA: hypothetical protein [Caudoviricetes sp.]